MFTTGIEKKSARDIPDWLVEDLSNDFLTLVDGFDKLETKEEKSEQFKKILGKLRQIMIARFETGQRLLYHLCITKPQIGKEICEMIIAE